MFCQNCSAFDTDDARFCTQCGESLIEIPRRERFLHLRTWKRRAFLQVSNFFKLLLDFSFHRSSSKMIGFLYRLSILWAVLLVLLFVLMSLQTQQPYGLLIILMIASLIFLFMVMCSRVILESFLVIFHMANDKSLRGEKLESKDRIDWNID
jgi:hypothetical protein